MTDTYAKNLIDNELSVTRALPSTDEAVTSSDIDLGGKLEAAHSDVELLIDLPALTAVELPSADTIDIEVQHGSSATPTTRLVALKQIVGDGSTRAAERLRVALPSNTERYINVKITAAGGVGDMSAKSATISLAV